MLDDYQGKIAFNVRKRGYHDLPDEPLVCRHVAKLVEELAEISYQLGFDFLSSHRWLNALWDAGNAARIEFDDKARWAEYFIFDEDKLKAELADLTVVIMSMSEVLGFDVLQAALEKSTNDVERGVRE